MAIGRISGPMLFANLERQGMDLAIEGNLLYFDVNRRFIGINTDTPQYDLHIEGANGMQANVFMNAAVTIANAYVLSTDTGPAGSVLTSDGAKGTYWGQAGGSQIDRKKFNYEIEDLPAGAYHEFDMDIGIASIVYALSVSRPVLVEVFATAAKNETNPYTFLATLDHLVDDGSVLMSDGSILQQRQYSIFANQEEPPQNRVYARVTNYDGIAGNVSIGLTYFAAVTDTAGGIYDTNVVESLPLSGYTGQTLLLKTNSTMYVWYDNVWNAVA